MERVIEEICDQQTQKIKNVDMGSKIAGLKKELPLKFAQEIKLKEEVVRETLEQIIQNKLAPKEKQISSLDQIIRETRKLGNNEEESKEITTESKIIQFGKSLEKIEGLQSQIQLWNQDNIKLSVKISETKLKELLSKGCTILVESDDNNEILKIEPEQQEQEEETKDMNDEEQIRQLQEEEMKKRDEQDQQTEQNALEKEVRGVLKQNMTLKEEYAELQKKYQKLVLDYEALQEEKLTPSQESTQASQKTRLFSTWGKNQFAPAESQEYCIEINQGWTPWTNAPKPDLTNRSIPGVKWIGGWKHLYSTYAGYGSPYSAMYEYKLSLSIPEEQFKKNMNERGYRFERMWKA